MSATNGALKRRFAVRLLSLVGLTDSLRPFKQVYRGTKFEYCNGMANPYFIITWLLLGTVFISGQLFGVSASASLSEAKTCLDIVSPKSSSIDSASDHSDHANDEPEMKSDILWRHSDTSMFMSFRSSAPHFWKWGSDHATAIAGEKLLVSGVVVGDAHIHNFGDFQADFERMFGVVDLDDGGRAPLLLDFVRFAVAGLLGPTHVEIAQMYHAYTDGLSGIKYEKPKVLKKALDISAKEAALAQTKFIKKVTSAGQFKFPMPKLKPLDQAPADIAVILEKAEPAFARALTGFKILDRAFRVKEDGGSAGLVREIFLVQKSKAQPRVFEFKAFSEPATAQYQRQLDQIERIAEIRDVYRGGERDADVEVIETPLNDFLKRPREKNFLKLANVPETKSETAALREMIVYTANWLGRKHGKQSGGEKLSRQIEKSPAEADKATTDLIRAYLKEIIRLESRKP
jgi:hypothetical protein